MESKLQLEQDSSNKRSHHNQMEMIIKRNQMLKKLKCVDNMLKQAFVAKECHVHLHTKSKSQIFSIFLKLGVSISSNIKKQHHIQSLFIIIFLLNSLNLIDNLILQELLISIIQKIIIILRFILKEISINLMMKILILMMATLILNKLVLKKKNCLQ